jgi:DNA polymerase III sliding clamp (beta) subunit (PCNA family)
MLKVLKFCQGAISKKDFVPYLCHFAIKNGQVTAYNGVICLSSPIPINIDCKPRADLLIKAIGNCSETIALSLTDTGRLKVQSGKFKAFIECIDEVTPEFKPEGIPINLDGELLIKALTKLYKFIGDDASRPWANGVLISNGSACATNNVCIIEHWLGFKPDNPINIPKEAIREILRIGDIPESIMIADRSITLLYSNGKWIKSQLLDCGWPDLGKILNVDHNAKAIDKELFDGLEALKPFKDKLGRIYFTEGVMSTSDDLSTSANYEVSSIDFEAIYNFDMLSLLDDTVTLIDWHNSPALFFGSGLRGAIIGMRR